MIFTISAKEKVLAKTSLYYIIKTRLKYLMLIVVSRCYFNGWTFNAMTAIVGPPTYLAPIQKIFTIMQQKLIWTF
jgi:hypothetical protein